LAPDGGRELFCDMSQAGTPVEVVVCIPAFRRPAHLLRTLESVAAQVTEARFAIVVVENDADQLESANAAADFLARSGRPGVCAVEPHRGNCRAINTAFETALACFPTARSLLMIDDDEVATPQWIERMVAAADASGADIVGGPVFPRFMNERADLAQHPAFCPTYLTSGPVPTIYGSGNCLIRRSVFASMPRPFFDLGFNFLGGGDADFFNRCRGTGKRFYWAADAVINETVPPERTRSSWIAKRGLRIGTINYLCQRRSVRTRLARLRFSAKLMALIPYALLRATRVLLSGGHGLTALHPVMVAIGFVLAVCGIRPEPYRADPSAALR